MPVDPALAEKHKREVEAAYAIIERAAIAGARAPKNISLDIDDGEVKAYAVHELCRTGRIKVEIYGRNFRRMTILTGPHEGKQTAASPKIFARARMTIGLTTTRAAKTPRGAQGRAKPSAPRPFPVPLSK